MKNNILYKFALIGSLLVLMNASYALDVVSTNEASTTPQNTTIHSTVIGNAQDWDLTDKEWTRYQQLMQGPNGLWYPQLTPPEVLGLTAETEEEKNHFAEIVAHEEHDKLARELNFDKAVHDALLRLYPHEPVIQAFDISLFNPIPASQQRNPEKQHESISLQSGDHIALLVDPNTGIDFTALPQLLADVKKNKGIVLDIFCVGSVDDNAIRRWAQLNNIPLDLVSQGRITLNHDNGKFGETAKTVELPSVLLMRNGQSSIISLWSLM